ncbi:hypothetical protein F750_4349 [Streptomyces sp. PAMC 26508]|nr:hypothetical protein F750_4349 [Streptomyces sp. PAMC 26508]
MSQVMHDEHTGSFRAPRRQARSFLSRRTAARAVPRTC